MATPISQVFEVKDTSFDANGDLVFEVGPMMTLMATGKISMPL